MEHSDQKYIDALLNNDTVLVREIYKRYAYTIKPKVIKTSGNDEDAADLFQDGLMAIYRKAKQEYFVLTCPFDAFIYRICRNIWINELKKKKRWVTFARNYLYIHTDIGDGMERIIDEIVCEEARKKLYKEKSAELSQGCRDILKLSEAGKSMIEIAEQLHLTHGFARKRKSECKKRVMQLMEQSPEFENIKRCMYE